MKAKMNALQNVVLFFGKSQPDGKNSFYIRQIQLLKVRAIYYTSVNAETKFLQQNTLNQHKPKLKSKQKGEEVKIKMGRGNGMT